MSGFGQAWIPGFDPASGALGLPMWSAAVLAAVFVAFGVYTFKRAGRERLIEALPRAGLLLLGAVMVWVVAETMAAGSFAGQRRALDGRLLELNARAIAPGSPLACLDGTAGELVESSCEKALFANPETVAAAVSYVAAQLSLLADGTDYEHRSGANYEFALRGLRNAVEADRFGIVAHLLVERDGCTAARCDFVGLLRDASRVADNMSARKYDAVVMNHAADWLQSALSAVASAAPAPAPVSPAPVSPAPAAAAPAASPAASSAKTSGLFFPSSSSIPPVSIMTPEPTAPSQSQQQQPGAEAQAAAKSPATAARKPASAPPAKRAANPANPANPASPPRPAVPDQANDQ
jgi:hypothetical protein